MKQIKKLLALCLMLVLMSAGTIPAIAEELLSGWIMVDGLWFYMDENGELLDYDPYYFTLPPETGYDSYEEPEHYEQEGEEPKKDIDTDEKAEPEKDEFVEEADFEEEIVPEEEEMGSVRDEADPENKEELSEEEADPEPEAESAEDEEDPEEEANQTEEEADPEEETGSVVQETGTEEENGSAVEEAEIREETETEEEPGSEKETALVEEEAEPAEEAGSEEDEREETAEPEENQPMTVSVYASYSGDKPRYGTLVTLRSCIEGVSEGMPLIYQWQYRDGDGDWQDVPGAAEPSYEYTLNKKNSGYTWRLVVLPEGTLGGAEQ